MLPAFIRRTVPDSCVPKSRPTMTAGVPCEIRPSVVVTKPAFVRPITRSPERTSRLSWFDEIWKHSPRSADSAA